MIALFLPALTIFLGFAAMASGQYHTLVLEHTHHFSAESIGTAVALGASSQIVLPWLLLYAGHKVRNPEKILRRAYLSLAGFLLAFPMVAGHSAAFACYFGIIASINVVSTMQSITMISQARPFGDHWVLVLRSMGTFGYATSCLLSSFLADRVSYLGLYCSFAIFALIAIFSSKRTKGKMPASPDPVRIPELAKKLWEPNTRNLIIGIAIANMAVSGATSVLSNFIHDEIGGSKSQVGVAWTVATFAEMPLIWSSIFFLKRFGVKGLILCGFTTSMLRMGLLWQVHTLSGLYMVQTLHGLFFGGSLSGVGIYLSRRYGDAAMNRLQLVSQSFYGGLAAAIGGKATGMVWSNFGLRAVYLAAFISMALAFLWVLVGFKEKSEKVFKVQTASES